MALAERTQRQASADGPRTRIAADLSVELDIHTEIFDGAEIVHDHRMGKAFLGHFPQPSPGRMERLVQRHGVALASQIVGCRHSAEAPADDTDPAAPPGQRFGLFRLDDRVLHACALESRDRDGVAGFAPLAYGPARLIADAADDAREWQGPAQRLQGSIVVAPPELEQDRTDIDVDRASGLTRRCTLLDALLLERAQLLLAHRPGRLVHRHARCTSSVSMSPDQRPPAAAGKLTA